MAKSKKQSVVLVVDDEHAGRAPIVLALRNEYTVIECDGGPAALALLDSCEVDLVIIDYMMPGMDGLELALCLKGRGIAFVGMTAATESSIINEWDRIGSVGYIDKPINIRQARAVVRGGLRYARRVRALERALGNAETLAGALAVVGFRLGLDRAGALDFLRKESNRRRVSLMSLADEVVKQVDKAGDVACVISLALRV